MEVRVCPNCTAPLGPADIFCPRCGAAVALAAESPERPATPGAYEPWRPSAGAGSGRVLGTIGGQRPTLGQLPLSSAETSAPQPALPARQLPILGEAPTPPPVQQARPYQPETVSLGPRPAARQQEPTTPRPDLGEMVRNWLDSFAARPRNEQVTLSLVGLGWAVAMISFFLPWAASNGIGVGTVGANPRPGAWAFDTPAGWLLFLLTLLVLGAVVLSGRIQVALPTLAPAIKHSTEIVLPMTLGGGLIGVGLLYLTLPWGCGSGPLVLTLGGCLMIAAGVAALFFPSPRAAS